MRVVKGGLHVKHTPRTRQRTRHAHANDTPLCQVGAIQHLCSFLSVLDEDVRLRYLPALAEVRSETDNWRFRQM